MPVTAPEHGRVFPPFAARGTLSVAPSTTADPPVVGLTVAIERKLQSSVKSCRCERVASGFSMISVRAYVALADSTWSCALRQRILFHWYPTGCDCGRSPLSLAFAYNYREQPNYPLIRT